MKTGGTSNISNTSAWINGVIECDKYSNAEFGIEYRGAHWESTHKFIKGHLDEDGNLIVALPANTLDPNSDYWYRCVVKYGNSDFSDIAYNNATSYAKRWNSFRTEMSFVYYPPVPVTDLKRESDSVVLCGYLLSGSEPILSSGYYLWPGDDNDILKDIPQNAMKIETKDEMTYILDPSILDKDSYIIAAYAETESGIEFGNRIVFENGEDMSISYLTEFKDTHCYLDSNSLIITNGAGYSVSIYTANGLLIKSFNCLSDFERVSDLPAGTLLIVSISNGKTFKVITK